MYDITFIIVNWNTKSLVLDCVRSIFQYHGSFSQEVIVIDNASEDGSVIALRESFPNIKIIPNKENLGFARANNQGLEIAQGKYIALINSDVEFISDCVSPMLEYMDLHSDVGMLGPKLLWQDGSLQGSCRRFPTLWNTFCPSLGLTSAFPHTPLFSGEHMYGYFEHDEIKDVDVLVGAFLLVRHAALLDVGGMDDGYFMYCEEVDWCKRFILADWKIRFFPFSEVIHMGGASSSIAPGRFIKEFCLSNLRYWNKYYPGVKTFLFRQIMILRYVLRMPMWLLIAMAIPKKRDISLDRIRLAIAGLNVLFHVHSYEEARNSN